MSDERDAYLYSVTPEEIVEAAGFELSDYSKKRPGKAPTFALKQGRLTGWTDLYRYNGEVLFGSIQLRYRVREPRGLLARRLDWGFEAGVWEWSENYRGDDLEHQLDRDCRAILLGLSEGRVLAGEQNGEFQIVVPYADDWQRVPGVREEVNAAKLSELDTDGLVDIRELAFAPFPAVEPTRRSGGLLGSALSKLGGMVRR